VWIIGWLALLLPSRLSRFRVFGLAYLILFVMFVVMKGKDYYLAPVYAPLFAAGAVMLEAWLHRGWLRALRPAIVVAVIGVGIFLAPVVLPVLSPERFIEYTQKYHLMPPRSETHHVGALPQYFGDQFGWPEMVEKIARAWNKLTPEERAHAAIFGQNYGEAGAIAFFGPRYGLPWPLSGHQNFYYWPPREAPQVLIVTQDTPEGLGRWCESVEVGEPVGHPYAMAEENDWNILICRKPKVDFREAWPKLKKWR